MVDVNVFRAAHLIRDVEFFRAIGTPVERELERAQVPLSIERDPEARVPVRGFFSFREACLRIEKLENIGFDLYGSAWDVRDVNPVFLTNLPACQTLFEALKLFGRTLRLENPKARLAIRTSSRLCEVYWYTSREFRPSPYHSTTDWHRLASFTSIAELYLGKGWRPEQVRFQGLQMPTDVARRAYPDTSFSTGHAGNSFIFPVEHLARSAPTAALERVAATVAPDRLPPFWREESEGAVFVSTLRSILRPYVLDGVPKIETLAEIIGASVRTMQRTLARHGMTYRQLIDDCRFEIARELMADSGLSIADIGMAVGYDEPANFARYFRRIAGMPPSRYRERLLAGDAASAARAA